MLIETQEDLFKGPVNVKHISERGIKVSKIFIGDEIKTIFDGNITRKGEIIEVSGRFFVEKEVECVRCLDKFVIDVKSEMCVFLKPASMLPNEDEIELKIEDLDDDFYDEDGEIDFYDYILRLGESCVPLFPLCSPKCNGLCQICGGNKNKASECRCDEKKEAKEGTLSKLIDEVANKMREKKLNVIKRNKRRN